MNPYLILGGVLVWLASLVGVGVWQHGAGADGQKVEDQKQFDAVNAKLTKQTTEANAKYRAAQADIITLQTDRDTLKNNLLKEKLGHDKTTSDLHAGYAARGLRYTAQVAGCGPSGGGTESTGTNTASAAGTTIVQLPDAITASLRQLVLEADQLADDYRLCYGYATTVK